MSVSYAVLCSSVWVSVSALWMLPLEKPKETKLIGTESDMDSDMEMEHGMDSLERKLEEEQLMQWNKDHPEARYCTNPNLEGERNKAPTQCLDPWYETKDCKRAFAIPDYRLGDTCSGFPGMEGNNQHTLLHRPESIGAKYINKRKYINNHGTEVAVLQAVVDSAEFQSLEKPGPATIVVHVRGFDVLSEKKHEQEYYHKKLAYYEDIAKNITNHYPLEAHFWEAKEVVLVTGDHRLFQRIGASKEATEAGEAAVRETEKKLAQIEKVFTDRGLKVRRRFNYNADCDFIYMINAKAFVPSGGQFDSLITLMVQRKNGQILGHSNKIWEQYHKN